MTELPPAPPPWPPPPPPQAWPAPPAWPPQAPWWPPAPPQQWGPPTGAWGPPPQAYAPPAPQPWAPLPPPPPYGWQPAPGWPPPPPWGSAGPWAPPPPYWGPVPPYWGPPAAAKAPALDAHVAAGRHLPGRWFLIGLAQYLIPVGSLIGLLVVVVLLGLPHGPVAGTSYGLLSQLLALGAVWLVARGVARQRGGWRAAFGFAPPVPRDAVPVLGWTLLQLAARFVAVIVLVSLIPGLDGHGGNVEGVEDLTTLPLVLDGLSAVVMAPVLEELMFRGILLHGLMRRMSFWAAAAISSVLFGSLHAMGAAHAAGIPLLVVMTSLFGFLQCLLVRRTARLGPAMVVHGVMNALTLAVALL